MGNNVSNPVGAALNQCRHSKIAVDGMRGDEYAPAQGFGTRHGDEYMYGSAMDRLSTQSRNSFFQQTPKMMMVQDDDSEYLAHRARVEGQQQQQFQQQQYHQGRVLKSSNIGLTPPQLKTGRLSSCFSSSLFDNDGQGRLSFFVPVNTVGAPSSRNVLTTSPASKQVPMGMDQQVRPQFHTKPINAPTSAAKHSNEDVQRILGYRVSDSSEARSSGMYADNASPTMITGQEQGPGFHANPTQAKWAVFNNEDTGNSRAAIAQQREVEKSKTNNVNVPRSLAQKQTEGTNLMAAAFQSIGMKMPAGFGDNVEGSNGPSSARSSAAQFEINEPEHNTADGIIVDGALDLNAENPFAHFRPQRRKSRRSIDSAHALDNIRWV